MTLIGVETSTHCGLPHFLLMILKCINAQNELNSNPFVFAVVLFPDDLCEASRCFKLLLPIFRHHE